MVIVPDACPVYESWHCEGLPATPGYGGGTMRRLFRTEPPSEPHRLYAGQPSVPSIPLDRRYIACEHCGTLFVGPPLDFGVAECPGCGEDVDAALTGMVYRVEVRA